MSVVRLPFPGRGDSPRATTIDLIGFPMGLGDLPVGFQECQERVDPHLKLRL